MNRREIVVLAVLVAALLVGSALSVVRRSDRLRAARLSPLIVTQPADSAGDEPTASVIDLNTATAGQLEALPGIGPVLAGRMIDYRTRHGRFRSIGELRSISGIGPKRYAAISGLVTLGPPPPDSAP